MAEILDSNVLEVTPCDVISTQDIIEAIKPKPSNAGTDLTKSQLENFHLDEVSTQALIENITKPIGQAKINLIQTEITTIPETNTQTIIRNTRPIRACQAAKKKENQTNHKNPNIVESVNAFIEEINIQNTNPTGKGIVSKDKKNNSNNNGTCDNSQVPDIDTTHSLETHSDTVTCEKSLETSVNITDTEDDERECPCGEKFPPVIIKKGGQETELDWVQCETCITWWHQHCAGAIQKSGDIIDLPEKYECGACITKKLAELQKHLNKLKRNSCLNLDSQNKNNSYKVKQKKDRTYAETKAPPPEEKNLIVIVDGVTKNYLSSANIKQEIAKLYPEIKIEHCYQLVKGGISIHVKDKESEKTLLSPWPTGAFGTETKLKSHSPSFHNRKSLVVKQVDPNLNHKDLCDQLKAKYNTSDLKTRRFFKNRKPLPIIKITGDTEIIEHWLQEGIKILEQVKPCEPYRYKYIPTRCFRCQRFGHTSKICFSLPRCAKCGEDHSSLECEKTDFHCVNCKNNHPAYDPQCPSFLTRQRKGIERRLKEAKTFNQSVSPPSI